VALNALPRAAEKRAVVRAMFDRIAPRYDLMNRILTAGMDQRWRRLALAEVGVGPGDRVIDLACGTGDLAGLARDRGARAVGVDFAAEMLRGARRRGIEAGFVQAEGTALPFSEASATVLVCGFALRNFVALPAIFDEAARVLAPGGRVALLEVDRPANPAVRAAHSLYFDRVVPLLGALLSDRAAYRYLPESTAYLPPAAELLALLEKSGFERVARRPLLLGAVQLLTGVRRENT
jgi:demethylmenaquinone methyltransferase/2-methoxy-6-polyprenyl-1,4-benzoquinol methylase